MSEINIVVADDHPVVRAGLIRFIDSEDDITVIAEATNGEQAYSLFKELQPDLVIIDVSMQGMSGLETLRRILTRDPAAKVIIYTLHEAPFFASYAMNSGAMAYVTKLSDINELISAIKTVFLGKSYLSSDIAQKMAALTTSDNEDLFKLLTAREFEIFCLLARGNSVKEISTILNIGSKTVANYQTSIKQKLDINSAAELVSLAVKYDVVPKA
jgi:DNA-binding NarL/FixJ family response regulator